MALPIPDPDTKRLPPWNVDKWVNQERAKKTADGLVVTYPRGKRGMEAGCGFYARPFNAFPCDAATFSYRVYFPADFGWVKGGKLPGLSLGSGDLCASGGDWKKDAGSFRLMWREGGVCIGYLYLPVNITSKNTKEAAFRAQSGSFKSVAIPGDGYGIDLWKDPSHGLAFKKGAWNTVRMTVVLNAPSSENGSITLTINGVTKTVTGVVFRRSSAVGINAVLFSTFFGGNSSDWEPKEQCFARFADFAFTRA